MATHRANRGTLRPVHLLATASALAVMLLPGILAPAALALAEALPVPAPVRCPDLLLNTGTVGWYGSVPLAITAPGVPENKWLLTNWPAGASGPAVATNPTQWMPNDGWEMWLTPASHFDAQTNQATSAPIGTYTYTYNFFIPGHPFGEVPPCGPSSLDLCFAGDNMATVYLNNNQVGFTSFPWGSLSWTCIYVGSSGPWNFGPNELRAEVYNRHGDHGGQTGYIAKGVLNI